MSRFYIQWKIINNNAWNRFIIVLILLTKDALIQQQSYFKEAGNILKTELSENNGAG